MFSNFEEKREVRVKKLSSINEAELPFLLMEDFDSAYSGFKRYRMDKNIPGLSEREFRTHWDSQFESRLEIECNVQPSRSQRRAAQRQMPGVQRRIREKRQEKRKNRFAQFRARDMERQSERRAPKEFRPVAASTIDRTVSKRKAKKEEREKAIARNDARRHRHERDPARKKNNARRRAFLKRKNEKKLRKRGGKNSVVSESFEVKCEANFKEEFDHDIHMEKLRSFMKDERKEEKETLRHPPLFQNGANMVHAFASLFDRDDGGMRYLSTSFVFIYQLSRSRGFVDAAAATYQYARTFGVKVPSSVMDRLEDTLDDESKIFMPETESLEDFLASAYSISMSFVTSRFVKCALSIVGSLLSLHLVGEDLSERILGNIDLISKKGKIFALLLPLIELVQICIRAFAALKAGVSLSDMVLADDPVRSWISESTRLLSLQDVLYVGLPVENKVSCRKFCTDVAKHLEFLPTLERGLFRDDKRKHVIVSLRKDLRVALARARNMLSTQRPFPYGVVIVGPPKIGKSQFSIMVVRVLCDALGIEYSPDIMYDKPRDSPYWDGYQADSQPVIHYSEVGNEHRNLADRSIDLWKEINSLMDTLRYTLNFANLPDKGVHSAAPLMVLLDVNDEEMHLKSIKNNPSADRRRFVFIRLSLKDKFNDGGICARSIAREEKIDPDFHPMDLYNIQVVRKIPIDIKKSHEEVVFTSDNVLEFNEWLRCDMTEHFANQDRTMNIGTECPLYAGDHIASESGIFSLPPLPFGDKLRIAAQEMRDNVSSYFSPVSSFSTALTRYLVLSFLCWAVASIPKPQEFISRRFVGVSCLLGFFGCMCFDSFSILIAMLLAVNTRAWLWLIGRQLGNSLHKLVAQERDASIGSVARSRAVRFCLDNACAVTLGTLSALYGAVYLYKRAYDKACSEEGLYTENIREIEERMGCRDTTTRIKSKLKNAQWNVQTPVSLCLHRGSPSTLVDAIMNNSFVITIKKEGYTASTMALGLKSNIAMANYHSFLPDPSTCVVNFTGGGTGPMECKMSSLNWVRVGEDLILFSLTSRVFRDIIKHFARDDAFPEGASGFVGRSPIFVRYRESELVASHKVTDVTYKRHFVYDWKDHKAGACGLPVIIQKDKGSCVAGIHSAGSVKTSSSYALVVTQPEILAGVSELERKILFVPHSLGIECEEKLEEPMRKSLVRFENIGRMNYYGKLPGKVMANNKSSLERSSFAPVLDELFFQTFGKLPTVRYEQPVMKPVKRHGVYINPFNITMRKTASMLPDLDELVLSSCVDEFYGHVISRVESHPDLHPLPVSSAINGVVSDDFIRRINASTSGGYGFPGAKSDYLKLLEDEITRVPVHILQERVVKMIRSYEGGEMCHPYYVAHLKDEPRSQEKVREGKTRVFYGAPLDFLIVSRMFLAPFYSWLVVESRAFCTGVGGDYHRDSDALFRDMNGFSEKMIAGDFSGFDTKQPAGIVRATCSLILKFYETYCGDENVITVVKGLLTDGAFPMIVVLKDLFLAPSVQPSGKYGTAEDNSIRNVMILMYVYKKLGGQDFFGDVLPITYGDDSLLAVKPHALSFYNGLSIQRGVHEIGMGWTDPNKSTDVRESVSIWEVDFLKRTFYYCERHDFYVMRLSHDSIYKALEWRIPSVSVNDYVQHKSTAESMLYECYFHFIDDRASFEIIKEVLELVLEEHWAPTSLISFDELEERFFPSDPTGLEVKVEAGEWQSSVCEDIWLNKRPHWVLQEDYSIPSCESQWKANFIVTWITDEKSSEELQDKLNLVQLPIVATSSLQTKRELILSQIEACHDVLAMVNSVYIRAPLRMCLRKRDTFSDRDRFVLHVRVRLAELEATLRLFDTSVRLESSEVGNMKDSSSTEIKEHETVADMAGDSTSVIDPAVFTRFRQGEENTLSVEDFFKRPVEIDSFPINLGAHVSRAFSVWDLYSLNPAIRSKLRNYAYFKASLHVRVAISGSPFHTGRVLVSYQPYASRNETLSTLLSASLGVPGVRPLLLNYLSQSRECLVMNVNDNRPLEMTLPFISPKPSFRLYNDNGLVISDVSSYDDMQDAGTLYFYTMNVPDSVSATPSSLYVQIYAWAEDVQLGCPTATQVDIRTESDERKVGPMEKVATKAAAVSSALSSVPSIGPFAMASTHVFSALGNVAAIFGWSKPGVEDDPMVVKNKPYSNGSVAIGRDTSDKISMDPLQELTVDPRLVGETGDCMVHSHIYTRPSYVRTVQWLPSSTSRIWRARVTPCLNTVHVNASGTHHMPTAMSFAARPYSYWRGDIVYTFDIVASKYHRGKFLVSFEPNIAQSGLLTYSTTNQFMKVIDIQETQTVRFRVEWAAPFPWLETNTPSGCDYNDEQFSATQEAYGFVNGYISVYPWTELQSPDSSSIDINIFAHAENLHLSVPHEDGLPDRGDIITESLEFSTSVVTQPLNPTAAADENVSVLCFGEEVITFRALCKRYVTYWRETQAASTPAYRSTRIHHPVYPPPNYTYGGTADELTHIGYLRYSYLGLRGSVRHRLALSAEVDYGQSQQCCVGLDDSAPSNSKAFATSTSLPKTRLTGWSRSHVPTNGGIEYEFPFYSNNLFVFSFADDFIGAVANGEMNERFYRNFTFSQDYNRSGHWGIAFDCAAGEDFTFLRYVGPSYYSTSTVA